MKKALLIFTLLYYCILSFALSDITIAGVVFTDADDDDYYEVSSKEHLIAMSMESESIIDLDFKQTVDIIFNEDPSKEDWNGDGLINGDDSTGFMPIGQVAIPNYYGEHIKEYDGNGKVIKNLYIDNDTLTYVGLFSVIRYGYYYYSDIPSIIHNTYLVDCSITSKSYSGGLVGYLRGAEVSDNTVSGYISGVRGSEGIVGYPYYCSISNCVSTAYLSLSDFIVGGVVFTDADGDGYYDVSSKRHLIAMSMDSESIIGLRFKQTVDVIFDEDPTKEDWNGDGLINGNDSTGFMPIGQVAIGASYGEHIEEYDGNGKVIKNLYIDNDTLTYVGLFSVIRYAYEYDDTPSIIHNTHLVDCNITSQSYSGGLVSYLQGAEVSDNTVSGYISGVRACEGIVGYSYNSSINNCVSTAYLSLSDITIGGVVFTDVEAYGGDYYDVSSKKHLIAMSLDSESIIGLKFKQTVDIIFDEDPTKEDWNGDGLINGNDSTGFMPIGQVAIGASYGEHIDEYDGNGKVIKNLYIDNDSLTYVGLFSIINHLYSNNDSPDIIHNTHLVDCNITSKSYSGGLVGYLFGGNLRDNTVSGIISGDIDSGGIVGLGFYYYLKNCISTAYLVWSDFTIGGLVFTDANGDGYYEVSSKAHLIAMSQESDSIVGLKFKQTVNIIFNEDPSKEDWNGDGSIDDNDSCGFMPIGSNIQIEWSNDYGKHIKEYDGNEHFIKNLFIDNDTLRYIGLFSALNPRWNISRSNWNHNGYIHDLHLVDCDINSGYGRGGYVGGIVGYSLGATIINCSFSGIISSSTTDGNRGGIAGGAGVCAIYNCINKGIIDGAGITGSNQTDWFLEDSNESPIIKNCMTSGAISGTGIDHGAYYGYGVHCLVTGNLRGINRQTGSPSRYYGIHDEYYDTQTTSDAGFSSFFPGFTTAEFLGKNLSLDYGTSIDTPWVESNKGRPYLYHQKIALSNTTIDHEGNMTVFFDRNPLYNVVLSKFGVRYQRVEDRRNWVEQELEEKSIVKTKISNLDPTIQYYVQSFAEDATGNRYYGDMVVTKKTNITYYMLDNDNTSHSYIEQVGCFHTLKFEELNTPTDSVVAWNLDPNTPEITDYIKGDSILVGNTDILLYARTVNRIYNITYISNSGIGNMPQQTFEYHENVSLLSNTFEKLGYKLNSWNTKLDGSGTRFKEQHTFLMPDSSITLYAQWEIDGHTITYYPNGGQGTMNSLLLGVGMDTTLTISAFSKSGYQFSGWNTQADGLGLSLADGDIITMGDSDINLYAQWTALNYKVNFYSNGGSGVMPSQNTTYGDEVLLSENTFSRLGYSFKDWNTDVNGLGQRYVDKGALTTGVGDVTLYAQWATLPYAISYINCELASNVNPTTYTVETPDIVLAHAIQRGKAFNGWFLDSLLTTPVVQLPQGSTGDKILYASWSTEYSVVYFSNGGTGQTNMAKLTAVGTDYTTKDNIFARSGYTFDKWNTLPDGTGTSYGESQNITLDDDIDFALYAIWTPIVYQIAYENTRESSNNNLNQYSPQTTTFILENLSSIGYTFVGWYADSLYHTPVQFIPQGSIGDTTLYANWEINTYAIKYYSNGGKENTIVNTFDYGMDTTLLTQPFSRKGYRFTGWNTTPSGSGTSYQDKAAISIDDNDFILYAQWEMEEYTIAYHNLLGCLNTNPITYTVFAPTTQLNALDKAGYTFGGWFLDPSFQNQSNEISLGDTGNVNLYAHWVKNQYLINYQANGGNGYMSSQTIPFESDTVLASNNYSRKGYEFTHWNSQVDNSGLSYSDSQSVKMSNDNLTLYAQWELVEYSIAYYNLQGTSNVNISEYNVTTSQALTSLVKTGFAFLGWFSDEDFINLKNDIAIGDTGNLDLYAKWELNKYNITYHNNGGSGIMPTQNMGYGSDTTLAPFSLSKKGYEFTHWNTNAEGNGDSYTDQQRIIIGDADIELYAQWQIITYAINYYNTQGAANSNASSFDVNTATTLTPLAREAYDFRGWFSDGYYTNKIEAIVPGDTGTIDLYAKWELKTFDVMITSGGYGNVKVGESTAESMTKSVDYGSGIIDIEALSNDNTKRFMKWSDGVLDNPRSIASVTSDTIINALWQTAIFISLSDTLKTYNGAIQEVNVNLSQEAQYTVQYKDENVSFYSNAKPIYAGKYDIKVSVIDDQLVGETYGKLTIQTKTLNVTISNDQSKGYGNEDPDTLHYTAEGLLLGDIIVGKPKRTAGEDPGYYPITLGSLEALTPDEYGNVSIIHNNNSNYDINFIGADFFIDSDIDIRCKWEYMLVVDNCDNAFASYQWYQDGVAISGATDQYYYNSEHTLCGSYQCEVTYIGSVTKILTEPIEYSYCNITQRSASISLYPNPINVGKMIHINSSFEEAANNDLSGNYTIKLYSLTGVLLNTLHLPSSAELEMPAPDMIGIYNVIIYHNDNYIENKTLIVN